MTLKFEKTEGARAKLFDRLATGADEMPRRPPADIERRRAEMREAGARLFAERGLDGASIAEVAASLGLSATTCSYYYRTRNELIYAILYDHATALHEALEATDPLPAADGLDPRGAVPPLARLEAMALALLQALAAREPAQRVLLAALHTLPDASEDTLRALLRGLIWRVERVLLLAVPRLARRRALLFPLAASFTAMAAQYVLWFRDDGRLSRAEYARLIARMAVAGGKAAYRERVGKARGIGPRQAPAGALLGTERRKRGPRSPG